MLGRGLPHAARVARSFTLVRMEADRIGRRAPLAAPPIANMVTTDSGGEVENARDSGLVGDA